MTNPVEKLAAKLDDYVRQVKADETLCHVRLNIEEIEEIAALLRSQQPPVIKESLTTQQPGQDERGDVYAEARECSECNHVGINDASSDGAACSLCGWCGPSPAEDECPGCKAIGTMSAACPKCHGHYRLIADATLQAARLSAPQAASIGAVLAYRTMGHNRPCGQIMGANGAGDFAVVIHGAPAEADAKARDLVRALEQRGHKLREVVLVMNEESYSGPSIRAINAGQEESNG